MAMFQYFKRVDGQYPGSKLPDPQGALAQEVPSRTISAPNTEVALLQQAGGAKVSTRRTYLKMSSEKKAEIAAEHGVLATVRYYASRLPEPLKERSVHTVTPINNVGVACLGQWIREIISTKFSKTAIRENFDPRNFCAIRYVLCCFCTEALGEKWRKH